MYDYFSDIVKHEIKACAKRHNLDAEDVQAVFQKLDAAQWYEPKYPQFTAFDLSLKYLDGKKAVELFTGSDIEILRKRVSICDYLNHPLVPFHNINELSELLDTFSGYLSDNKDSLLKTGYPKAPFQDSPWLESKLGGLLCTKIPIYHPCDIYRKNMFQIAAVVSVHEDNMYTSLKKDPKGNWEYNYIWDRHPEFTEVKPHEIEGSGKIIQYLSSNDGCENYSDAGSLPFISDEDIVIAEKQRGPLLELKIQTIKLLLSTLENGDVWNLWSRWLSIAGELCDPEMITFLLKMDSCHNKPRYWFSETCSNSGLLGILYILTHCEKELKYGSLRRMKDAFRGLPQVHAFGLQQLGAEQVDQLFPRFLFATEHSFLHYEKKWTCIRFLPILQDEQGNILHTKSLILFLYADRFLPKMYSHPLPIKHICPGIYQ